MGGILRIIKSLLDHLVPPSVREDPRLSLRHRGIAKSLLSISGVVSFLFLVYLAVRPHPTLQEVLLFAVAVISPGAGGLVRPLHRPDRVGPGPHQSGGHRCCRLLVRSHGRRPVPGPDLVPSEPVPPEHLWKQAHAGHHRRHPLHGHHRPVPGHPSGLAPPEPGTRSPGSSVRFSVDHVERSGGGGGWHRHDRDPREIETAPARGQECRGGRQPRQVRLSRLHEPRTEDTTERGVAFRGPAPGGPGPAAEPQATAYRRRAPPRRTAPPGARQPGAGTQQHRGRARFPSPW